ncbi:hypothetical protein [Streptomyces sp. NPDC002779]|uniref:hypothetical protein n=1 Tax=Streptomyces sp. NPDC002779 TaxID=3364664 RepID=UPI0036B3038B
MIPAEHGAFVARYSNKESKTPGLRYSTKPVVAWDDMGAAMVLDGRRGCLVRADSYSNFDCVLSATSAPIVGAVAGGGWRAEYSSDDGSTSSTPIVAWNVRADGGLDPIYVDADGLTGDPTDDVNFMRIYLPDNE